MGVDNGQIEVAVDVLSVVTAASLCHHLGAGKKRKLGRAERTPLSATREPQCGQSENHGWADAALGCSKAHAQRMSLAQAGCRLRAGRAGFRQLEAPTGSWASGRSDPDRIEGDIGPAPSSEALKTERRTQLPPAALAA